MNKKANKFVCVDKFLNYINLTKLNANERRLALKCVEIHKSYNDFVSSHANDKLFVDKNKNKQQLLEEHCCLVTNEMFMYFNWLQWSLF